jgi:MFS transporter, MHS family, proline/betaine transporter
MNLRHILPSAIGTLMEWAEFSYYGYLATLFARLFFPELATALGIMASLSAFAMSYVARPFGAYLFGYIGDRHGRRAALMGSLLLMGIVSIAMGLLPTYQTAGNTAVVLLLIFRFMQGIAVSGEGACAAVYLIELQPKRPYFISSFISTAAALGMFVGVLLAFIVSLPQMPAWAWRVPFYFGGVMCGVGIYIRCSLNETLHMDLIKQLTRSPVVTIAQEHKLVFIKVMALAAFVGIYIYTCNVWWVSFSIENDYFSAHDARLLAMIGQAFVVVLIPCVSWLADYRFHQKTITLGLIGAVVVAPLIFVATVEQSFALMVGIFFLYALVNACVTGVMFKYMADLFPVAVRFTGPGLSWSIAIALFAGFSPLIAQFLSKDIHHLYAPALYVVFSALIALTVLNIRS